MGSSSKDEQPVIGYWYKAGLHLGWSQGPVGQINKIWIGDRVAWEGEPITASTTIEIDQPDLYGGESKEGGIVGTLDVMFGEPGQPVNEYLKTQLEGNIPAYRGLLTTVFRGRLSANVPRLQPWAVEEHRPSVPDGANVAWAIINNRDANPAYMIWECMTDTEWGMSYPSGKMDKVTFLSVASALYNEGFGISLEWNRPTTIEDFVNDILNYIAGTLREDPVTGLFTLKLVRKEDPAGLPIYDESNIYELVSLEAPGIGEIPNEVIVRFTDVETYSVSSLAAQDMAMISLEGGIISETLDFPGITDAGLAARVAERELAARVVPTNRVSFKANRSIWGVLAGDLFKLSWASLGLSEMAFRVLDVDIGDMGAGYLTINAVQDTFSFGDSSYLGQEPPRWVSPNNPPVPLEEWLFEEAGYYDLVKRLGDEKAQELELGLGFPAVTALKPTPDSYHWNLYSSPSSNGTYEANGRGFWGALGTLVADVDAKEESFLVTQYGYGSLLEARSQPYGYLGSEKVAIKLITYEGGGEYLVVVDRGVLDTVPTSHPSGVQFWAVNRSQPTPLKEMNAWPYQKMLPTTSFGRLPLLEAPAQFLAVQGRKDRPYPPGGLSVNGAYLPSSIDGGVDMLITWKDRDRLLQTASLIPQSDGNIGPEEFTEYWVRLTGDGVTNGWQNLGSATSLLVTEADEQAWFGSVSRASSVVIELYSQREGLRSWTTWSHTVVRVGWGFGWGFGWGGSSV